MPIVVNSNTTATVASFNLSRANDALRTSLARLSSGKRIVNPADDAGGLSVANKLASKLDRTEAVRQNVQNGISFLQVQDGSLSTIAKIVDRMSELRTMASDVTKNAGDIENYSKEVHRTTKTVEPNVQRKVQRNQSVLDESFPVESRIHLTFAQLWTRMMQLKMQAVELTNRFPGISLPLQTE